MSRSMPVAGLAHCRHTPGYIASTGAMHCGSCDRVVGHTSPTTTARFDQD